MSLILITGMPGSGKTAHAIDLIANDPTFKGRPIYQMGVPELVLDHQPVPPVSEWVELRTSPEDPSLSLPYFVFPSNSLILIDEAQRVFRPRSVGSKVPPEVQAFETHRHTGVDFILITQHPNLIDSNVRKLVGRHYHVHVTSMGRYLLDWPRLGDVESKSERELAVRKRYQPPKRVFGLYKSAEAHTTIKRKLPFYFYLAILGFVLAAAAGYYAYTRLQGKMDTASPLPSFTSDKPIHEKGGSDKITKAEYFASLIPREKGLFHTAPRYDEVTKPVDAPWPQGCFIRAKWKDQDEKCRCIDQQGNRYATTDAQCRSIVANGIFKDWGEKPEKPKETAQPARSASPASPPSPEKPATYQQPAMPPSIQAESTNPRPIAQDSPWRFKNS